MNADGEPLALHHFRVGAAKFRTRGIAGFAGFKGIRWRLRITRAEHPAQIAARLPDIANGHWSALALVRIEQPPSAPAAQAGFQLPAQIDGVLSAHVHAEATGRRRQMRRIAGEEGLALTIVLGHELASHPWHDR